MGTMTHQVLTEPEPGTTIHPLHLYTDDQQAQIDALRAVRTAEPSAHSF